MLRSLHSLRLASSAVKFSQPSIKPFVRFHGNTNAEQVKKAVGTLKLGKLNHVAIATNNLEEATTLYRDIMGAKVSAPEELPAHGVITVFVDLGNTKIELLKPLGENSPIKNFLDKKPSGGIHHVCIEVENIYTALEELRSKGVKSIDEKPKIGAHGKPVVFLHPKSCAGVLVELEQA
eukprot:TRINITY_DN2816_c0_g1_i1.p1 TRINITY_DN2816_c0_g1~~TRINITY_DN2816_c0_g1_i1.p1  ORF type:complete len:178 (-),score=24.60 TRINITY_DN2816_c0_g1_i1:21-554(-)